MVKVLNLSGMGSHSFSQLKALQYIEDKSGKPISAIFDIIIGQSTGALLAAYLTIPNSKSEIIPKYSVNDVIDIFKTIHSDILSNSKLRLTKKQQKEIYIKTVDMFESDFKDLTFDDLLLPIIIPTNQFDQNGYKAFIWSTTKIMQVESKYLLKDILPGVIALKSLYPPHPIIINEKITYHYDDANLGFSLLLHSLAIILNTIKLELQDINVLSLANSFLPFVMSSNPGIVNQYYKGINDLLIRDAISNVIVGQFLTNYLRIDLSLPDKKNNYNHLTLKSSDDYLGYYSSYLNSEFFNQYGLTAYIDRYIKEEQCSLEYHDIDDFKDSNLLQNHQCIYENEFNLLRGIVSNKPYYASIIYKLNQYADYFLRKLFLPNKYQEMQKLANKHLISIKVYNDENLKNAYKKIATVTHPDKTIGISEELREDMQKDFMKANDLLKQDTIASQEIYKPVIDKLYKTNLFIKVADTSIDITKGLIKPTLENSLKISIDCIQLSAMYYGSYSVMLPISSMGALYQIYDGDYKSAIKTVITSVGITFMTTAVYSTAPALSVILATSYTGYAGYTMLQNGYELYDEWQEYIGITNNLENDKILEGMIDYN